MSFCVRTKSKEFIDASQRLDIHPSQLESIVHEYINQEGVSADSFPSNDYILSKTKGKEGVAVSEAQYKLWEQKYQNSIEIPLESNWQYLFSQLENIFPKEMIGIRQDNNEVLHITIAKPIIKSEIRSETEGNKLREIELTPQFYSGDALGSDKFWKETSSKLGIKTKDFTVKDWDNLSNSEKESLNNQNDNLTEQRDLLLPRLMSGKLELK